VSDLSDLTKIIIGCIESFSHSPPESYCNFKINEFLGYGGGGGQRQGPHIDILSRGPVSLVTPLNVSAEGTNIFLG
jgi:hypothetical protein